MAKYTVRNGFVLHLESVDNRGKKTRQAFNAGSDVELDDQQYLKYRHQVEPTKKGATKSS